MVYQKLCDYCGHAMVRVDGELYACDNPRCEDYKEVF